MPTGDFPYLCNAICPAQCSYRLELLNCPPGMPVTLITEVMVENHRLRQKVEYLERRLKKMKDSSK